MLNALLLITVGLYVYVCSCALGSLMMYESYDACMQHTCMRTCLECHVCACVPVGVLYSMCAASCLRIHFVYVNLMNTRHMFMVANVVVLNVMYV